MSRPTQSQVRANAQKIDNIGGVLKPHEAGGPRYPTGTNADDDRQFPMYPDYNMPVNKEADDYMSTKTQLLAKDNIQGNLQIGEKDVRWIQARQDAEENARFKLFVETSIPRGTPWAKEFFERIQPGWYQSKFDIISQKLELIKRFMKITLEGVQSMEDMYLIYILATGRIALPTTIADIIRPANQGLIAQRYTAGTFSPTRYISSQVRIAKTNYDYMANFAIPGIDLKNVANGADVWAAQPNETIINYGTSTSQLLAGSAARSFNLTAGYGTRGTQFTG